MKLEIQPSGTGYQVVVLNGKVVVESVRTKTYKRAVEKGLKLREKYKDDRPRDTTKA